MSQSALTVILNMLLLAGGVLTLYSVYFCVVAIFGFKRQGQAPQAPAKTRFALVVAARNEAAVIGQLVDSLTAQNYPEDLYDVIVAPNNCTDDTRAVAQAHGAKIFDPFGEITSKGEVLAQVNGWLLDQGGYDAVCVFDADNLAHPNFLQKMNNAYAAGARAAQGFRDSKNPDDSPVSTCYSVGYWMMNRFYNAGRSALGLSAQVSGSGFMVGMDLLRELGGWRTETMTEDYEFTAQCVLAGQRVHYVPGAVIYDEQPLTFFQSWRQRRRWSTGSIQGMAMYGGRLCKAAVKHRSRICADLALTFFTPAMQLISLLVGVASLGLTAHRVIEFHLMRPTRLLLLAVGVVALAALACWLVAALMVALNRSNLRGTGPGILCFPVFLLSHVVIGLVSLVKPQRSWGAVAHTRAVSIRDMTGQE